MDQIKELLQQLKGSPDPRAKKLQIILGSILLINAVRERKLKRRTLPPAQPTPAEKKAAIGDIAGRMAPIKPTRGMIEGAFNALGGFGKKAAALLQRASKPVVPIRTGVEALRRGTADFSRAPGAVQRIVRQPAGPYIQAGFGPAVPTPGAVELLIPDLPEFKVGSIVTTYIKVKDKLLIHRRAKGSNEELTLSTPSGFVDASDGSYIEAAVREVKEESGLELQDVELMPLRVTQIDGKYMVAFYVERDALPDVPGPQPEFAKELDMKYDFAGISGQKAEAASGSVSGHFLADIAELPKWLRTNKEFKNRMFYDNLVALMLQFPDKFTLPDDAANDVVYDINALDARLAWVPKKVFSSQDLKDTWLCQFEQTRVSPCEPWELRDALIAADKFKEHDRLGAHLATNPDIVEYRKMTNRIKALKEIMKGPHEDKDAEELRTLEKEFSDTYLQMRKVHVVRSMKPGDDYPEETFSIPNPVHALSYREDEGTNFANPSGTPSKYDPSGAMMAMNTGVLKAIAYPEMIADKHMAISILESLWHCAGDVSLSNDPRCFPARVLGQLREYEAARVQMDQQQRARDYMATRTAWPEIKRIIRAMKNALIGAQVVSFSEALEDKIEIDISAAKVASQPSPQGTSDASTPASASVTAAAVVAISSTNPAAIPAPAAAKRPSGMPSMARGVAVVVPRGIGAPFGFEGLLPRPIGSVGVSGR
jgi:ADP-ribose pyrophosphatase YjhB (NUDIX family)